jgi:hypothetical protein
MTFEGGQLDEHSNRKAGIITQKRVREIAPRGLSLNLNVRDMVAIARIAIAEPLARLPRRLPHEPS